MVSILDSAPVLYPHDALCRGSADPEPAAELSQREEYNLFKPSAFSALRWAARLGSSWHDHSLTEGRGFFGRIGGLEPGDLTIPSGLAAE